MQRYHTPRSAQDVYCFTSRSASCLWITQFAFVCPCCGSDLQNDAIVKVAADTLQVSGDDEVEDWVLRAIQTGLMEAKMDQMQRVVVIRRCTNRVFGPLQWKVTHLVVGHHGLYSLRKVLKDV